MHACRWPTMPRHYHADMTVPAAPAVWVFGSNTAGRHGKGAARVAARKFGAKRGMGEGRMPRCYAIPTKDAALNVLPFERIASSVRAFIAHAMERPDETFFVTRVACELAGYSDATIAPLFRDAPGNCDFAESWRQYLGDEVSVTDHSTLLGTKQTTLW